MTTFEHIADLPLEVESYELEGLELDIAPEFTRLTTVVRLQGAGQEGVGEHVTYEGLDQIAFRDAGPTQPLAGRHVAR